MGEEAWNNAKHVHSIRLDGTGHNETRAFYKTDGTEHGKTHAFYKTQPHELYITRRRRRRQGHPHRAKSV